MAVDQILTDYCKLLSCLPEKTVSAIIPKFLSSIHILLKVDCFEGFVNQRNTANFMASKTSRCNFQLKS